MKLITDTRKLSTAIQSIAKRGAKLDADIHTAGLSCMEHARLHNDARMMQNLIAAMPKGGRTLALVAWCEEFAPVTIDRESLTVKLKKGRVDEDFRLDAANETPFHAFTKERDPKKALEIPALIARMARMGDESDATKVAPAAALLAKKLAAYAETLAASPEFREEAAALVLGLGDESGE